MERSLPADRPFQRSSSNPGDEFPSESAPSHSANNDSGSGSDSAPSFVSESTPESNLDTYRGKMLLREVSPPRNLGPDASAPATSSSSYLAHTGRRYAVVRGVMLVVCHSDQRCRDSTCCYQYALVTRNWANMVQFWAPEVGRVDWSITSAALNAHIDCLRSEKLRARP